MNQRAVVTTIFILLAICILPPAIWAKDDYGCPVEDPTAFMAPLTVDGDTMVIAILFVTIDPDSLTLPAWADSVSLDIRDFLETMSGGQQAVRSFVVHRPEPSANLAWLVTGVPDCSEAYGYAEANAKAIAAVDSVWPGYWVAADHVVNFIACVYLTCVGGCAGGTLGLGNLVDPEVYPPMSTGCTLTMNFAEGRKNPLEIAMMHEYGHGLGDGGSEPGKLHYMIHPPDTYKGKPWSYKVNMGQYMLVMNKSFKGNPRSEEGLVPYIPMNLLLVGNTKRWLPDPIVVSSNRFDFALPDLYGTPANNRRIAKLLCAGSSQYFIIANHQGQTAYDSKYGGKGLSIWHILPDTIAGVRQLYDLAWDLEVASGKWSVGVADPESGVDSLEADSLYTGGEGDLFCGDEGAMEFNCRTNPNSNAYRFGDDFYSAQSTPTHVEIRNIHRDLSDTTVMRMDILFTPVQKVLQPNGGEEVDWGDTVIVEWDVRECASVDDVGIWIISDSGLRDCLGVVGNTGSYSFPVHEPCGEQYRVVVESFGPDGTGYADSSDATFTINSPLQRVLEPNGGADSTYARGDVMTVRWDACADAPFVDIFLTGGCSGEERVLATVENSGTAYFRVLQPEGSDYKIGVRTAVQNNVYADESDGPFRIEDPRICGIQQQQ